jgi:hypothetical protein
MRLWSIHPCYLDRKGLISCWREGLLARKVLLGETSGYRHHPQLYRFKIQNDPIETIDKYLQEILKEAKKRGYKFNRDKIMHKINKKELLVTDGQLQFEIGHLKKKVKKRDPIWYRTIRKVKDPRAHPLFRVIKGKIEGWEKGKNNVSEKSKNNN